MKLYKAFLIIFLFPFLFLWTSCQEEEDIYLQNYSTIMEGKLKQVVNVVSSGSEEVNYIVSEYFYDETGKLIKVSQPSHIQEESHYPLSYQLYTYNELNLLYKISEFDANLAFENGYVNLKNTFYYYGADEKVVKELVELPEINGFEYYLYQYENDRLEKIEQYNKENIITGYINFIYDTNDLLINESIYNSEEELISYTIHSYENGLNVKSEIFNAEHTPVREIKKVYNENGLLIMIESTESTLYSSAVDYILKYEYY